MARSAPPTLRFERQLLRGGVAALAGCDEVGRGALSGPVTVAMVVLDASTPSAPQGVRDSKLLTAEARQRLAPKIRRWANASGVGHASPAEIDQYGLIAALRLAGHRALVALDPRPGLVLLDGNHDYLSVPEQESLLAPPAVADHVPPVRTMVKADLRCAAVAAASVLAKTERDAIMVALAEEYPSYGWAGNKGYAAPDHLAALAEFGPSPHHRLSWRLRGVEGATVVTEEADTEIDDLEPGGDAWWPALPVAGGGEGRTARVGTP